MKPNVTIQGSKIKNDLLLLKNEVNPNKKSSRLQCENGNRDQEQQHRWQDYGKQKARAILRFYPKGV